MSIHLYEADPEFVLQRFREGQFDYVDGAQEILETDFFRFLQAKKYLSALAQSYPSPRKKHDVPVWFYVASKLSMRLHGVHAFHAYPYIVRTGGMLHAFGAEAGRKVTHPDSGDVTLCCEASTTRTATTGRLPQTRTSCASSPRTPFPSRSSSGSTPRWRGCGASTSCSPGASS